MPVISRLLRISEAVLYRHHEPPHFHASYAKFEITVDSHFCSLYDAGLTVPLMFRSSRSVVSRHCVIEPGCS